MTLANHVYAIQNLIQKGPVSQNYSYSLRLIAHLLGIARAEALERLRIVSDEYSQTICMDVSDCPISPCKGMEGEVCKRIRQTVDRVPTFIGKIRVSTLDGKYLSKINPLEVNIYDKEELKDTYYLEGERLFFPNSTYSKVLVHGIFQDPFVTEQFNCSCTSDNPSEGSCPSALDTEFKIPATHLNYVYSTVLQYLANSISLPKRDETTNYKDDTA